MSMSLPPYALVLVGSILFNNFSQFPFVNEKKKPALTVIEQMIKLGVELAELFMLH